MQEKDPFETVIIVGEIWSCENRIEEGVIHSWNRSMVSQMTMILDLGQKSRSPLMTGFNAFKEVTVRCM